MTKKLTPELIERHRQAYDATAGELYTCWTCGNERRGDEFYFVKKCGTGRGHRCKYCDAQKLKKIFTNDAEVRRRRYRKNNDRGRLNGRRKAKYLVEKSLKKGDIVRPETCQSCGKTCVPDAHHPNGYDTPEKALDIKWLCRECHILTHEKDRVRWAKKSIDRISEEYKFRYAPT